jgi:LPS-assembly protein
MMRPHAILMLLCCLVLGAGTVHAQSETNSTDTSSTDTGSPITFESLPGGTWIYDPVHHTATGTNGAIVKGHGTVLTADVIWGSDDPKTFTADGHVSIQRADAIWTGEHMRYNFETGQMDAEIFRMGRTPVYAYGNGLHGNIVNATNQTYTTTNAYFTSDDIADPGLRIKAKRMVITPNKRIEAYDATVYMGKVPVFFFPYYTRNLGPMANNFNFTPGYRSGFGPFLLTGYRWFLNDQVDGLWRTDYRAKRGFGVGPDVFTHLGPWGEGAFKYYYLNDHDPGTNQITGQKLPHNRERVAFDYQVTPVTNLEVKTVVRYQGDPSIVHDFFENEYRQDPQPNTFFDVDKFWRNFSLDTYVQPQVNRFQDTVERLPEIRLTGYRQELGKTPIYYESESSAGYYKREFGVTTNSLSDLADYAGARADTFHQLTLPETLFGWLNFTPRAGGRFTYYGEESGPGAITNQTTRGVFNTGAEVSFKASRLWPEAQSAFLDVDGLRHIIEPSVNYVYVPHPGAVGTNEVPQYDSELPSLLVLPIEYPEYNSIDSIDSQNVIRWGMRNRLQTKRNGQVEDLVDWQMLLDWRLAPHAGQNTFGDLQSHLILRPRSWLTLESLVRYNINDNNFTLALHTLTLQPNDRWSWSISHFYARTDLSGSPTALGPGNNLIANNLYYRINENWGLHMGQHFEAQQGKLQEQYYTVYRDLRSWTGALSLRVLNNSSGSRDVAAVFTFSLKAMPKYNLGSDNVRPYGMLAD